MARIVELIYTTTPVGSGVGGDPVRIMHQLFTKQGVLVATHSSWSADADIFAPNEEITNG